MTASSQFWDALAPHHFRIEDNYLDVASVRRVLPEIRSPVLIVGAGQGLIVAELRQKGFQCDGVDLSCEMIKYARIRRGLELIHADAKALPFAQATYETIIYATGVIDFIADEQEIRRMLTEGKRVVTAGGKIFVALYRLSPALERFTSSVGLLRNNQVCQRESLELYLLSPGQMVAWVAKRAGGSRLRALTQLLRMSLSSTWAEKMLTMRMQKLLKDIDSGRAIIDAAAEPQPYRNEAEARRLFERLAIPIRQFRTFRSCYIAEI